MFRFTSAPDSHCALEKVKKIPYQKVWNKFNGVKLIKDKMDLNNRKMKNHPPSPDQIGGEIGGKIIHPPRTGEKKQAENNEYKKIVGTKERSIKGL